MAAAQPVKVVSGSKKKLGAPEFRVWMVTWWMVIHYMTTRSGSWKLNRSLVQLIGRAAAETEYKSGRAGAVRLFRVLGERIVFFGFLDDLFFSDRIVKFRFFSTAGASGMWTWPKPPPIAKPHPFPCSLSIAALAMPIVTS